MSAGPPLGAVILAGGRASRLGGRDKALIAEGGRTLLERAVAAARTAGALDIVIVGPPRPSMESALGAVTWTREQPAYAGPVAALWAGLGALPASASEVLVLAADLPAVEEAVPLLVAARVGSERPGTSVGGAQDDGVVLRDRTGRHQWLCALYARAALDAALAGGAHEHASLRSFLAPLALRTVDDPRRVAADIDTFADLDAWRRAGGAAGGRHARRDIVES